MAAHYRHLASEAALQAQGLHPSKWRDTYEKIAAHWTELAAEIDGHGGHAEAVIVAAAD